MDVRAFTGRSAHRSSTRRSTANAARWKTASRSASSTFMPIAPVPQRCGPSALAVALLTRLAIIGSSRWLGVSPNTYSTRFSSHRLIQLFAGEAAIGPEPDLKLAARPDARASRCARSPLSRQPRHRCWPFSAWQPAGVARRRYKVASNSSSGKTRDRNGLPGGRAADRPLIRLSQQCCTGI